MSKLLRKCRFKVVSRLDGNRVADSYIIAVDEPSAITLHESFYSNENLHSVTVELLGYTKGLWLNRPDCIVTTGISVVN